MTSECLLTNPYILREIIECLTLSDIRALSHVNKSLKCFQNNDDNPSLFEDIKKRKVLEYLTEWIKSVDNFHLYDDLTPHALSVIQSLDLSDNGITVVPPELGYLNSLQEISLSRNRLKTIPSELGRLINLQELWLFHNPPDLTVPSELKRCGLFIYV